MTLVRSRPAVLLVVLLAGLLAISGCARVRTALAVQPDDTVAGEIVIATPETGPDDHGPNITVPTDLTGLVDVTEYRQDGYVGSLLRFDGLSFAQVSSLNQVAGEGGGAARIEMRRAGNRVLVTGTLDLTTVPVDKADFQLKISFPGEVLDTNGEADSGTVSWTFTPGEVGDIAATVAFDDPNAPSALNWTLGLAGVVLLVAVGVVLLALRTRNPPVEKPVSPRRG